MTVTILTGDCRDVLAEMTAGSVDATVKPIALMRWLVRMITPPGGVVLDPFAGSGSTGIAAGLEGFDATLIELDPGHVSIARARIDAELGLFARAAE